MSAAAHLMKSPAIDLLLAANWDKIGSNTGNYSLANSGNDLVITQSGTASNSGIWLKTLVAAARSNCSIYARWKYNGWSTGADQPRMGPGGRAVAGPDFIINCLARLSSDSFQVRAREFDDGTASTVATPVTISGSGGAGHGNDVEYEAIITLTGTAIQCDIRRYGVGDSWTTATGVVTSIASGQVGFGWNAFAGGIITLIDFQILS